MTMIDDLQTIAKKAQVAATVIDEAWSLLVPILEQVKADRATIVVKADGERQKNVYTVVVSGGPLGEDFFRTETDDLSAGIAKVVAQYAAQCW